MDGFIARTFSPQDAHDFLTVLLRTPDYLRYCCISYSRGGWYITQNAPHVPQPSLRIPTQILSLLLDFSVGTTQGTVVPQPRWVPADEVDVRRYVHDAMLQLPIFFVNRNNGAVGFGLPDILQGLVLPQFGSELWFRTRTFLDRTGVWSGVWGLQLNRTVGPVRGSGSP